MSDSMIERVARAIEQLDWQDPKVIARAAIAAMRDPTEEMFDAGAQADLETFRDHTPVAEIWNAMVDRAVAEPKPPAIDEAMEMER